MKSGFITHVDEMSAERTTVMLVEDDLATRELFEFQLRVEGFEVLVASDGLSALRLLDRHVPDVVILDLGLPQISGFDVQQEIVSNVETQAIPIIVVTGSDSVVATPVFRTLRKPITLEQLIQTVQHALGRPATPLASEHGDSQY